MKIKSYSKHTNNNLSPASEVSDIIIDTMALVVGIDKEYFYINDPGIYDFGIPVIHRYERSLYYIEDDNGKKLEFNSDVD